MLASPGFKPDAVDARANGMENLAAFGAAMGAVE